MERTGTTSIQGTFSEFISVPKCKICGGRSTGVHYGVVSCEGCKAFFKRGISNNIQYKCYFGQTCPITTVTRGRCKACRFKRCKEEGMDLQAMKGRAWKANEKGQLMHYSQKIVEMIVDDDSDAETNGLPKGIPTSRDDNLEDWCEPIVHLSHFGGGCMTPVMPKVAKPTSALRNIDSISIQSALGEALSWSKPKKRPLAEDDCESLPSPRRIPSIIKSCSNTSRRSVIVSARPSDCNTPFTTCSSASIDNVPLAPPPLGSVSASCQPWPPSEDSPSSKNTYTDLIPVSGSSQSSTRTSRPGDEAGSRHKGELLVQYGPSPSILEKTFCLSTTLETVENALEISIMDLIMSCRTFRDKAVHHGIRPFQPETHLSNFTEGLRAHAGELAARFRSFAFGLPGFSLLDSDMQHILLTERTYEFWTVIHCEFVVDGEMYFLLKDSGYHLCRYWLELAMEPEFLSISARVFAVLRRIQLTVVERYLLLCVALFNPDTAESVDDKTYLNLLYSHYLDALALAVSYRMDAVDVTTKLNEFFTLLPFLHQISIRYVLQLDLNQTPLRVRKHGSPRAFDDIMGAIGSHLP